MRSGPRPRILVLQLVRTRRISNSILLRRRGARPRCLRSARAVRFLGPFLVIWLLSATFPASAHTPVPISEVSNSPCVVGGGSVAFDLWPSLSPSNREWDFIFKIRITGGDAIQRLWWEFIVRDPAQPYADQIVGRAGAPVDDWVTVNGYVYVETVTVHVSGNAWVQSIIRNYDATTQCFQVVGDAVYYTV